MIKSIINLPRVKTDNEEEYISKLLIISTHADTLSTLKVNKTLSGALSVQIIPSLPECKETILRNVLGIHRQMELKTNFSKSSNLSPNISFTISF